MDHFQFPTFLQNFEWQPHPLYGSECENYMPTHARSHLEVISHVIYSVFRPKNCWTKLVQYYGLKTVQKLYQLGQTIFGPENTSKHDK